MEATIYDVTALTDKQLRSEYDRLNGNVKTNDELQLFVEVKAELSFRLNWKSCN